MLYIERTSDDIEHTNELHLKASKTKLFTAKRDFLAQCIYFLYISKYDSYRHFRTQFCNLLTQLTTVN